MASDTLYIAEPKAAHTHTVIFLHGRDSNGREFASELFESEASEPVDQPRTLQDLFPNIRWVFPSAIALHSSRFSTDMSQWFDMWSVENPAERPELQYPGLHQSIEKILTVIKAEETLVPRERIFLAGISQGFATAIATFFTDNTPKKFAGLIGLSSWMPALLRTEDYPRFDNTADTVLGSSRSTPIFLSHSVDDDVVPIDNGRELRDTLRLQRLTVEWRQYEDGGHWVNEPQGVDDMVRFISKHMARDDSMPLYPDRYRPARSPSPHRRQYQPHNMDTTLDVAIYHPTDQRDPHHWAINIRSPMSRGTIHQVYDNIGGRGYYVGDVRWHIRPNSARLFRQAIFIGRLRWLYLRRIRRLIQSWPVNNTSIHWNYQRWIVEIVYWLWNAGLLVVRERSLRRLMRMREYWQ
ncbi:alpha/beta-hydrolase [Nemania sp. NC0429]|nr:alpha/beta-hydrolase [Nemania sp. NC0429]